MNSVHSIAVPCDVGHSRPGTNISSNNVPTRLWTLPRRQELHTKTSFRDSESELVLCAETRGCSSSRLRRRTLPSTIWAKNMSVKVPLWMDKVLCSKSIVHSDNFEREITTRIFRYKKMFSKNIEWHVFMSDWRNGNFILAGRPIQRGWCLEGLCLK